MKGFFWNSHGLRDLAKHRFLFDCSREHNLDFIAILETGKHNYSTECLDNFCAGAEYFWHWNPPRGMSGGILLGFNLSNFVVDKIESGDSFLKFNLTNKSDGFRWALMAVYGAAQDEHKGAFLSELVRVCSDEVLPLVMGGDFNIIRYPSEKNNDRFNSRWPNLFNSTIEILNLKEIVMPGRQFTWASYADVPTYEKLGRVLVSTDWELKFPLASV